MHIILLKAYLSLFLLYALQVPQLVSSSHHPKVSAVNSALRPSASSSSKRKPHGPSGNTPSQQLHSSLANEALCNSALRSDPKLGGANNALFAFIRNQDIWISDFDGNEVQLTFCSEQLNPCLSCGVAEYVMQVSQTTVKRIC
jgi:hypothetical protein